MGQLFAMLTLLSMVLIMPPPAPATELPAESIKFVYQELNSPWHSYPCSHKHAATAFDWDISCTMQGGQKNFWVHLSLNYYPKSTYGGSAYEVLYWVSNQSAPREQKFDSSTVWIHNQKLATKAQVFELSQGIENDYAALRLTIKTAKPNP